MLSKLFPLIKAKPLSEKVQSRDAFIYLDRVIYYFGWTEPVEKRWSSAYNMWTIFTTILVLILLPISIVVEYVHRFKSFSAGEFLGSLEICVNMYGCSLKCGYTMMGHRKFQVAKRLLDLLDKSCVKDEERARVHRYVALSNLCYVLYNILFSSYVVISFTAFFLKGRHTWRMFIPMLDTDNHFYLFSCVELTLMSSIVLMQQCTDVCPLAYMSMARCHITLLKDRLRALRLDFSKSEDEHSRELTQCIQDHRLILEYVNALRPAFSGTIFVQFLLIGIVLGLSTINVVFFSTFWTGLGTLIFMFDVCLETFPFCYLCNVIMDDCQELSECLFQSNWISASRSYKSTLVYFLHNLQQPIILMAGGVFQICMQTNLSMVKLTFSVVTLIRQFNIAEKFQ
ncbi:uncharacterized protein Dana_GF15844 [Drosophila ananassae]|uniref:Odorant receptor n=1 Tax=Drosophila ananassae TaxID=7217 RepID=B3MK09_DROAN|nr:odorant receptor 22a [Drosophila ananassae]EDV32464.2 uncharacterized protein Dana_GF15844 [Drosophila ananassae]